MTRFFLSRIVPSCLFLAILAVAAHAGEAKVEGPEPPPALTVDDLPVPITRAQVGDWASYVTENGDVLRLTVVERWNEHNDDHLVVESSIKRGRKKRVRVDEEQISVKDRVRDIRDLGPDDFLSESSVLVNGRKLNCIVVHYHEDGELRRQSYFSDRVPVFGLVRGVTIEGNKRTTSLRLDDFDFADEDDN